MKRIFLALGLIGIVVILALSIANSNNSRHEFIKLNEQVTNSSASIDSGKENSGEQLSGQPEQIELSTETSETNRVRVQESTELKAEDIQSESGDVDKEYHYMSRADFIVFYCEQYQYSKDHQQFCEHYLTAQTSGEIRQFLYYTAFHRSPDPLWGADSELDLEEWQKQLPEDLKERVKLDLPRCNDWICFMQINTKRVHDNDLSHIKLTLKDIGFEQVEVHALFKRGFNIGFYLFRYPVNRGHFMLRAQEYVNE